MVEQTKSYRVVIDAGAAAQGSQQLAEAITRVKQAVADAGGSVEKLNPMFSAAVRSNERMQAQFDATARAMQKMGSVVDVQAKLVAGGYKSMEEAQNTINQAALKFDPAAKEAVAAFDRLSSSSGQLLDKYDQLGAARARYAAEIQTADQALKSGIYNEQQYAAVLAGAKAQLDAVSVSASNAQSSFLGLNRIGRMELQAAGINFVQGIAGGISPLRMAQAESMQVMGALIQGGAVTMKTMLGVGGAIAGVAAAVGTMVAALVKGQEETAAFNRAIKLTADASGMTRGALDGMVASVTKFGEIGPAAARAIATEMTASGKLSSEVIEKLLGMTADFAKATGKDAEEAGKELTKLFSDPLQAMQHLEAQYNLLSVAQRRRIQDLIAEGDKTGAQLALADALNARTKNLATDGMGILERAWHSVERAASDAWDAMKGIGRGTTLQEQLADVNAQISELERQKQQQSTALIGQYLPFAGQKRLDELYDSKGAINSQITGEKLDAQLAEQAARLQQVGKDADDAAKKYDSFTTKQHDLTEEIKKWDAAVKDLGTAYLKAESADAQKDIEAAIERAKVAKEGAEAAYKAMRSPLQEAQDSLAIARRSAGAGPISRAALQAQMEAEDQARHSPDRDVQNNAAELGRIAALKVTIQQNAAVADQNRELSLNAKLSLATAEAWMQSGAAGQAAAARQQAAIQSLTQPINAAARGQQIIAQQVADAAISGAQQVRSLQDQASAQERLAVAAKAGPMSERAAQLNNQILDQTRDLRQALELATNPTQAALLRAQIDGIADGLRRADAAAQSMEMTRALEGQAEQMSLIRAQLGLVGANDNEQQIGYARAQAQVDLIRMGRDAASAEGQEFIKNAENLAAMTIELQKQRAIAAELPGFYSQMVDTLGQGFTNFVTSSGTLWEKFKNFGVSALQTILQEEVKLMMMNPLKNMINGNDNLPTWDSSGAGSMFSFSNLFGSSGGVAAGGHADQIGGAGASGAGLGSWLSGIGTQIASWFFADGGIMTNMGPVPLRTYSGGGIANSPQMAVYGEGATPEAFVPVPSGKIPVEMRLHQPQFNAMAANRGNDNGGTQVTAAFHIHGVKDPDSFRRSGTQVVTGAARELQRAMSRNG